MGEPAEPTPRERAERRALSRRIVEATVNDEPPPQPVNRLLTMGSWGYEVFLVLWALAQEVKMLDEELRALQETP